MKTQSFFKLGIFAIWLLGFSACEELIEAANVELDINFSETFTFAATVPTDPLTGEASFAESATLDLAESEAADYLDKIQEIEIQSVTLTVLEYSGAKEAVFSGELDLGNGFNLPINSINLKDLFDSGESLDLSDQAGAFNHLKDQLKNQKQLSYMVNASISEVPVDATVRFDFELMVTANPVD